MMNDLDDLLGTPRAADPAPSMRTQDVHKVVRGVSIPWLMQTFRMGRGKVDKALRDCPPLGTHPNGGLYYDLATAAEYLVEPKRELKAFLKTVTAKDLPDELRESFWNAKLKEAKYRTLAGELWPTPAVMEVFGETYKTIKTTVQLWVVTVEEDVGLTDGQRSLITRLSDKLMQDLHKALVMQAKSNVTKSELDALEQGDE